MQRRKIAFLGWSAQLTHMFIQQFAEDNAEQVASFDRHRGRILLHDGTEIFGVFTDSRTYDGLRIDQIILADDRRMDIVSKRNHTINMLLRCRMTSDVPEDFAIQHYGLDIARPLRLS